jgi:hypothetical protein
MAGQGAGHVSHVSVAGAEGHAGLTALRARIAGRVSPARRGAGGRPRRRVVRMAVAETSWPSVSGSPSMRR